MVKAKQNLTNHLNPGWTYQNKGEKSAQPTIQRLSQITFRCVSFFLRLSAVFRVIRPRTNMPQGRHIEPANLDAVLGRCYYLAEFCSNSNFPSP